MRIFASEVKKLRNREIPYVKVLWSTQEECEATWDLESALRERYPYLFQMDTEGTRLLISRTKLLFRKGGCSTLNFSKLWGSSEKNSMLYYFESLV